MDSFEEGPKTMHTSKKSPCLFSKVWDRVLPFLSKHQWELFTVFRGTCICLSFNRLMFNNIFAINCHRVRCEFIVVNRPQLANTMHCTLHWRIGGIPGTHAPVDAIYFIFMHFLANIFPILSFCPKLRVWRHLWETPLHSKRTFIWIWICFLHPTACGKRGRIKHWVVKSSVFLFL